VKRHHRFTLYTQVFALIVLLLVASNTSAKEFSVNDLQANDFQVSETGADDFRTFSLLSPAPISLEVPGVLLAKNSSDGMEGSLASENPDNKPPFEEPRFTRNKLHQYLGLASLALAIGTIPTRPDDESEGPDSLHSKLAVGAYAFGAAAVATGFMYHSEDILNGFGVMDPDNLHMGLGFLGTLGYMVAVANAPESTHAAAGIVGLVSMGIAIGLTW